MRHLYGRVVAHLRVEVEDPAAADVLARAIEAALHTLSDTEQAIIRGRFGVPGRFGPTDGRPRAVDELGDEFGITADHVRRTEVRAIRRLQHPNTALRLLFELAQAPLTEKGGGDDRIRTGE
jgi:DNA-directed RNA polymerase sigma subunit (sigma70/sigma32)